MNKTINHQGYYGKEMQLKNKMRLEIQSTHCDMKKAGNRNKLPCEIIKF